MTHIDYLTKKYGLRMTLEEVSSELKMKPHTIITTRSSGRFKLPMYRDGRRIFADVIDMAEYLDKKRSESKHNS